MAISMRSFIGEPNKANPFLCLLYGSGYLTATQLNQYTIVSQQDRINMLENETALQRLQINELNRRATSNTENLKQLERISSDLESLEKRGSAAARLAQHEGA